METILEILLDIVDEETNSLRQALRMTHNATLPAVNLPHEILAIIFEMACLEPVTDVQKSHLMRCSIMGTCSRWRATLVRVSAVWSLVHVKSSSTAIWPPLESISTALDRSGGLPFLLNIETHDLDVPAEIAHALDGHTHRCKVLHLTLGVGYAGVTNGPLSWTTSSSVRMIKGMTRLSSAILKCEGVACFQFEANLSLLASLSVSIEELSLDSYYLPISATYSLQEFPNIRYLRIKQAHLSQSAVELIRSCPRIQTLLWESDCCSLPNFPNFFALPQLRKLSVSGELAIGYIQSMNAPLLELLVVNHHEIDLLGASFTMFPNLMHLCINFHDGHAYSPEVNGLSQFLHHHSTIQELTALDANMFLAIFLASKDTHTSLFNMPQLGRISLPIWNLSNYDANSVLCAEEILNLRVGIGKDNKLVVAFVPVTGVDLSAIESLNPRLRVLLDNFPHNTELVRPRKGFDVTMDEVWRPKDGGFPQLYI